MAETVRTDVAAPDQVTLAAFVAMVFIGGSNVVAVSLSNGELPPFFGAGLRFAVAGAILLGVVAVRRIPFPRGPALIGTLLYGVIGFAGFYSFAYWALRPNGLPASVAAVVLASVPLLTFFFAQAHGLETFRWRPLVGAVIAIAGIAVLIGGDLELQLPVAPLLAAFGAAAAGAEGGVVIKRFPPNSPVTANAYGMLIGALLLLALSLVAGENWTLPGRAFDWGVLVYLVLAGSVALFVLFLFVLKRWTATGTSYFTVLMPIVAAVLGAWVLDQPITVAVVLGGLVVLAGVYIGALSHGKVPAPVTGPKAEESEALAQRCSTC
ncbi:MAG: DMT family transporter [Actinomycetota bacterium]